MAIKIDEENQVVVYENEPEDPRSLFPNIPEASTIEGGVGDVLIDGVSIVDQEGNANIPTASNNIKGVASINPTFGISINQSGALFISGASSAQVKQSLGGYKPLTPDLQDASVFYGLAKAAGDTTQSLSANVVGNYTEGAKSKIAEMLNAPVEVSGTTPAITALPGISYICGEVATLAITLPESGCIDVVFTSGSTPTVLTITPPTGQTVKWANGFDPDTLDADTTYEINIANGLGVCGSWT